MSIWDGILMAIDNLRKRKGRTFLTALGVAIGTASIVGMIALGIGLQKSSMDSFEQGMEDMTVLNIYPNYENTGPNGNPSTLKKEDIESLADIPSVIGVSPVLRFNGNASASIGRRYADYVTLIGVDTDAASKLGYNLEGGMFFTGDSNESVASFMFPKMLQVKQRKTRSNKEGVSQGINYENLDDPNIKTPDVVAKTVTLTLTKETEPNADGIPGVPLSKDYKMKIVGRMSEGKGEYGSALYVSLDTVEKMNLWYQGNNYSTMKKNGEYSEALLKVDDIKNVEAVVESIRAAGYDTWSPMESIKEMNKFFFVLQLILGGIGALSLLVASIGIVNTMIMSILERTKEIGIMKVIGATIPQIRNMFLVEAGIIGIIGGIAGIVICYILLTILNFIAVTFGGEVGTMVGEVAKIPLWLSAAGMTFSTLIGVLAGVYPANRAANISALQAIREE